MSVPSHLIFGTSYVANQRRANELRIWAKLTRELNPDSDIWVVDSASPIAVAPIVAPYNIAVLDLGDNIGHLFRDGQDGWGRAFSRGLELGRSADAYYTIHIECDLLLAKPVAPIIEKMANVGVPVAAPLAAPYQLLETACFFAETGYLDSINLIERYAWAERKREDIPEHLIEQITEGEFFLLPLRGIRNDSGSVLASNIRTMFKIGIDWITHCVDHSVYREFLKMNGREE